MMKSSETNENEVPSAGDDVTIATLFRSLPLRLKAERAAGWSTRFHFRIEDAGQPEWTVVVVDGRCEVKEGLEGKPDCVVTTTEEMYLGIERGTKDPQFAYLSGKVKVSNVGEMMKFGKAFRRLE